MPQKPLDEIVHCWADFDEPIYEYRPIEEKLRAAGERLSVRNFLKMFAKEHPSKSFCYRGCRDAIAYRIYRGTPVTIPDVHKRPVKFIDFPNGLRFPASMFAKTVGWRDEYGREVIEVFKMDGDPYIIARLVNP